MSLAVIRDMLNNVGTQHSDEIKNDTFVLWQIIHIQGVYTNCPLIRSMGV